MYEVKQDMLRDGLLGATTKLRNETTSFVLFVRPCLYAWNNSTPTGRISWNLMFSLFSENMLRKFNFH